MKGNVIVDGWLEAKNIKGVSKGLFTTIEKLKAVYPLPHDGWWALVGGVNTGFAVWDSKQRSLLQVCSLPIHKAMERVRSLYDEYKAGIGDKVIVRVEDPRQRTWFGTERMSREMERKKLQGVGSVKRDASIWDDYLKELGVEYEMVAPKRNVTKLTQERFKALTGWQKQTNEHGRDGAMLVYGF